LDSFAACGIDIHAILAQRGDDGPGPTSWENRPRTLAEA
jgi:hypothetical protein